MYNNKFRKNKLLEEYTNIYGNIYYSKIPNCLMHISHEEMLEYGIHKYFNNNFFSSEAWRDVEYRLCVTGVKDNRPVYDGIVIQPEDLDKLIKYGRGKKEHALKDLYEKQKDIAETQKKIADEIEKLENSLKGNKENDEL